MTSSLRGLQRHPAVGLPANQQRLTRPIVTPQPQRLRGTRQDLRLAPGGGILAHLLYLLAALLS